MNDMTPQTRIHPETGAPLTRGVRRQTVRHGPLCQDVDVAGWYPEEPQGDGLHSGADLVAADQALAELKAQYAQRIRAVRRKLGLTQEAAGRIIGGGKRAFQKYESGALSPSDAAIGLIELLDRHPDGLEVLRDMRG